MYWSDWEAEAVMIANKYNGQLAGPFISNLSRVTDIKVLHSASQQGKSVWEGCVRKNAILLLLYYKKSKLVKKIKGNYLISPQSSQRTLRRT